MEIQVPLNHHSLIVWHILFLNYKVKFNYFFSLFLESNFYLHWIKLDSVSSSFLLDN